MRCIFTCAAVSALSFVSAGVLASTPPEHPTVESKVVSVGLFKNGLAVVRRTVELPGTGTYAVIDVPEPVHGTFWIQSDRPIETRITSWEFDEPRKRAGTSNLQADLAGRQVTVHFRNSEVPPTTGRVVSAPPSEASWNRQFTQPRSNYYWWGQPQYPQQPVAPVARFLALETQQGDVYLDTSIIGSVHVHDAAQTIAQRRSVLLLTAEHGRRGPVSVDISYLTKGLAWAPSYRADLTDSTMMRLEQKAVIKNELEPLHDIELDLISGFPSVEYAHVLSPMSPVTNWANFFTQLNQQSRNQGGFGHAAMQQRVMSNYAASGGSQVPIPPSSEGVDMHYQSIGRRTLLEGDSLMLSVAEAHAEYQRIVEWIIPDPRDAQGHYHNNWENRPEREDEVAWDAVRFSNPFDFPMTTAPAMMVEGDRFNGQRTSDWVNPGEETTLRITKALSIRTLSTEVEEPDEREFVSIGGRQYRRTKVRGELLVCNHRKDPATMVIRQQFSGELIEADGATEETLRKEGVYSINQRNELEWTITLDPGEERTLVYRYGVLVRH